MFSRSSHGIHLRCDRIKETLPVVSDLIEIEMGTVINVCKVRIRIEALQDGFKFVSGPIKVERVCSANEDVDFSF